MTCPGSWGFFVLKADNVALFKQKNPAEIFSISAGFYFSTSNYAYSAAAAAAASLRWGRRSLIRADLPLRSRR